VSVLLSARDLGHAFGHRPLFEGASFTLSEGDRIGLIGPNGAGKSTLLQIIGGLLAPDRGEVARRQSLRIAYLEQVPEFSLATVREVVTAGLGRVGPARFDDEARVEEWVSKLDLDPEARVAELSGGWKKRVALARVLASDPELVLLDEPTNHLDVESIVWLEKLLAGARFATLTVTHDRLFLQRVANRILELDKRNPGGLLDVAGDYATYVEQKAEAMAAQERREQTLRNTLRRETEWLRRGAAARTTKQAARIERAGALADEVAALGSRNRVGAVELEFMSGERENARTRRLIEARGISKRFAEHVVFEGIDLLLTPRTRLGLLGPNGCGKTTLLRVLTGGDEPSEGSVFRADGLRIVYFEQDRASLDPARTVADTVSPDGDFVHFQGSYLHRHGYLERFLFRAEQMRTPVGSLSGGEQSRLLLARLMLSAADVLVLDEPTNDLDLPTLGVLEEALESFDGAVLLVTHDRYFLDQVTTELLVFHGGPGEQGQVTSLAGIEQWERWHQARASARSARVSDTPREAPARPKESPTLRKGKLTFSEQRDWDGIEGRILAAEERLAALEAECELPEVVSDGPRLIALGTEIAEARAEIERLYARWAELGERLGV